MVINGRRPTIQRKCFVYIMCMCCPLRVTTKYVLLKTGLSTVYNLAVGPYDGCVPSE